MADLKISQLSDGGASQATDEYVVARSGSNFRIDGASVAAAATSVGTLSSLTVSGDLTVDTSTLKVDSTNNRVGVGTASPVYTLDVQGGRALHTDNSDVYAIGVRNRASLAPNGNYWIGATNATSPDMVFSNNAGTERMRLTDAGNLAVDTNTLYVDAANDRVGIGTASPVARLTVNGETRGIEPTLGTTSYYLGMSTNGVYLGTDAAKPVYFITNATERMRLDASGNLGLGVTPSAWETASSKALQFTGGSIWSFSTSQLNLLQNAFYNTSGNLTYINNAAASAYRQISGAHSWYTAGAGTGTISFTTAMTLDASGNLGIGTTDIGTPLTFADTNAKKIQFNANAANHYSISKLAGGGTLGDGEYRFTAGNTSAGSFTFSSAGTERARITSGGDFLINRTSSNGKLTVWSDGTSSAANAIGIFNSAGSNIIVGRNDGLINTGAITESPYNHIVGGTNRDLFVDNGGDIGYVSSVRASKTNIAPVTDVDWLMDLNPVTFNFRKRDEDGQYTDEVDGPLNHGLIAEEVEAVNADLCFYDNEEMGGALRGVNYSHLITPMLKLIQTQQSRIEALEARLEALEA